MLVAGEVADRHPLSEEVVNLLERKRATFGHTENGENQSQKGDGGEDESDLGPQVGVRRVEEVRDAEGDDKLGDDRDGTGHGVCYISHACWIT